MSGNARDSIDLKSVAEWRQEIRQAIAKSGTLCHFRRHDLLFGLGAPSSTVYSIKTGLVELAVISRAGREMTESIRGPGDTFGFGEIILQETRRRQATIMQDAEIWCLDRERFLHMLSERPEIVLAMLGSALDRASHMEEMRAELGGAAAQFRVGYVLLQLAQAERDRTFSSDSVQVRVSHEEIGRMCGLSRQTVTTELGALRLANMVRLGSRSIEVCDLAALERLLDDVANSSDHMAN